MVSILAQKCFSFFWFTYNHVASYSIRGGQLILECYGARYPNNDCVYCDSPDAQTEWIGILLWDDFCTWKQTIIKLAEGVEIYPPQSIAAVKALVWNFEPTGPFSTLTSRLHSSVYHCQQWWWCSVLLHLALAWRICHSPWLLAPSEWTVPAWIETSHRRVVPGLPRYECSPWGVSFKISLGWMFYKAKKYKSSWGDI